MIKARCPKTRRSKQRSPNMGLRRTRRNRRRTRRNRGNPGRGQNRRGKNNRKIWDPFPLGAVPTRKGSDRGPFPGLVRIGL